MHFLASRQESTFVTGILFFKPTTILIISVTIVGGVLALVVPMLVVATPHYFATMNHYREHAIGEQNVVVVEEQEQQQQQELQHSLSRVFLARFCRLLLLHDCQEQDVRLHWPKHHPMQSCSEVHVWESHLHWPAWSVRTHILTVCSS